MAFICYSSIHRHSKWHPIRLGCWWKLFSFNIIRRFFFGYGTDHYSDYYFLEGAENPESSIKFNNYKSINKSWCILGWFKISKIHFPVYKTTRRNYPRPGWHLKELCHAIFYLFKKLKLVFKYKWSSFAVPMNGKEGHGQRTGTRKIGVNVFKFKCYACKNHRLFHAICYLFEKLKGVFASIEFRK